MIKRVSNTFYFTNDMDASVGFYRDTLGLALRYQAGKDWAEFDVGGVTVALHGTGPEVQPHSDGATVMFECDDLDGTTADLAAKGATFVGDVFTAPHGRFATLRDPSGNIVQIYEPAAQHGPHHG